ncbi:MAG: hypothetical protein V4645_25035 [Pseudomonadota bacterium]
MSPDAARTEPKWESRGGTALPAGPRPEPGNLLEQAEAAAGPLIVDGYRRHGAVAGDGMAPTAKTTDTRIREIYLHVGTAFQEVAKRRGEHLPAGGLSAVVLGFFQVEEMEGCLLDAQLAYELKLYEAHGLREVYRVQTCGCSKTGDSAFTRSVIRHRHSFTFLSSPFGASHAAACSLIWPA